MQDYPFRNEKEILRKYLEGKVIDPDDMEIVDELSMTGFIRRGFSLSEKQETAIVTELGRVIFRPSQRN